jgi:hypothetical protein
MDRHLEQLMQDYNVTLAYGQHDLIAGITKEHSFTDKRILNQKTRASDPIPECAVISFAN